MTTTPTNPYPNIGVAGGSTMTDAPRSAPLRELIDELVRRVGPDEACRMLGVSSLDELDPFI